MPLIESTTLLRVADRAAMQYKFLYDAFGQLVQEGGDFYADIVTSTDDSDVEIPTLRDYHQVDKSLNLDFTVRNGTPLSYVIGAMNAHFNTRDLSGNPLQVGGWDGFLHSHDCRVSWYFNRLFVATQGLYMLAVNVFSENNDILGTVELEEGEAVQFTDGVNYGTGAITNPANGSNFAATQLKIVVCSMDSVDIDLRLSVKDTNNDPKTIDVTVPGDSSPGDEILVGNSSDRFLDVMGVSFVPLGNKGTAGDTVTINNKKERQISL